MAAQLTRQLLPCDDPRPVAGLRRSAVLIALHERDGAPALLFTRRASGLSNHSGQISFPGGGFESQDANLAATALRETREELAIAPGQFQVIGRLPDLPSISFYQVVPYVAVALAPLDPIPEPREVAEVILPPLAALLMPGSFSTDARLHDGQPVATYSWEYQGHVIWGLTARILGELLDLIQHPDLAAPRGFRTVRINRDTPA